MTLLSGLNNKFCIKETKMKFGPIIYLLLIIPLLLCAGVNASTVSAADEERSSPGLTKADKESSGQPFDAFEEALSVIQVQNKSILDLQSRIKKSEGIVKKALEIRLVKSWISLLQQRLDFAKSVADQADSDADIDKYREKAVRILGSQTDIAGKAVDHIKGLVEVPKADSSAAELAAAYTRIFAANERRNHLYSLIIEGFEVSKLFKVDVSRQETLLRENLIERAANVSILLDLAMNNVADLRASVLAVPDDAELKAKLFVAENNVQSIADEMATVLTFMGGLEMDTAVYQEQLIGATGEITKDIFDINVLVRLLKNWGKAILNVIQEKGPGIFFKLLLLFIIIFVFRKIANIVRKVTERGLERSSLRFSELLRRMIVAIAVNTVIMLGILIGLSQVGISLGPLLAGLGVVGFVIGFALQDLLANFASGLMILAYSPFDVGDVIDAGGVFGKVSKMSLVNTTIMTFDNQTIIIPNNKIWGDVIKNVTAQNVRRVDLMFGISYSDDIPKTERVLKEITDAHDKVLSDPETMIKLHELGESSVNFIVRPWVKTEDYWDVYWDITRAVKMRFDEEGISIPFPQRDVHLYDENTG